MRSTGQPEPLEEWYQELERIASLSEELAVSKP
jgi:hypothetical protein